MLRSIVTVALGLLVALGPGGGPARAQAPIESELNLITPVSKFIHDAALKAFAKHPEIRAAALAAILKVAKAQAIATKDPGKAPAGVEFFSEQR